MNRLQQLERKQDHLQSRLTKKLMSKRTLDIEINKEFEELKKIEILVEISSQQPNFAKLKENKRQRANQDWTISTTI